MSFGVSYTILVTLIIIAHLVLHCDYSMHNHQHFSANIPATCSCTHMHDFLYLYAYVHAQSAQAIYVKTNLSRYRMRWHRIASWMPIGRSTLSQGKRRASLCLFKIMCLYAFRHMCVLGTYSFFIYAYYIYTHTLTCVRAYICEL